jgi:hypothetical protein
MIIRYTSYIYGNMRNIFFCSGSGARCWTFTLFISNMQEIGVLVTLFCLFHACVGLILPSLAKLRTMYAKLSVLSLNFRSVGCKFCYPDLS